MGPIAKDRKPHLSMKCHRIGKGNPFKITFAWNTDPSPLLMKFPKFREYSEYCSHLWRSPCSEEEYFIDVLDYGNTVPQPDFPYLSYAIFLTKEAFQLPEKVPMIKLENVFERTDLHIWKSSPGLPWKENGYLNKGNIRDDPRAKAQVLNFWKDTLSGYRPEPDDTMVVNKRHITERGTNKIRAIMCYPATINFGEVVFATPLTEKYVDMEGVCPIAFGYETLRGGSMKITRECTGPWYTATDFKSFDKTVPVFLIQAAFNILKSNIDFNSYHNSREVPDSHKMEQMFDYLRDYFIHTPFRLCDGYRYKKHGGIASGSGFTTLIGSIVNYILIQWASLEQNGVPRYMKVFGDDSICAHSYKFDIERADSLFQCIKMSLNLKKSQVTRNLAELTFLGFQINHGYPKKQFDRWMASLFYPETIDKEWKTLGSRALSLLYCCSGFDERFDGICREVVAEVRKIENFKFEPSRRFFTLWDIGLDRLLDNAPSPEKLRLELTEVKPSQKSKRHRKLNDNFGRLLN